MDPVKKHGLIIPNLHEFVHTHNMTLLFITHDLNNVKLFNAHRVCECEQCENEREIESEITSERHE